MSNEKTQGERSEPACPSGGSITLGPEVWQRVFASPLYQEITGLVDQTFNRGFGFSDWSAMGITPEAFARLRGPLKKPIPWLRFCELICSTKEGQQRCLQEARYAYVQMASTRRPLISTCYAGLTELAVPIILHDKYYGCIAIHKGGLLLHEPNEKEWGEITQRVKGLGVDLAQLKQTYFETKPVSQELFDVMVKLLTMVIGEIVRIAVEIETDKRRIAQLETELQEKYQFSNIIGQSKPMLEVFRLLERIKDTESPVLIQGETGTGKELVARAIHYHSPRRDKPFYPQNCAAVAESLLEAELFGHTKGAFTGAIKDRRGLFEIADGGTVFLDEIAEMSPQMQAKLLRVIEQGEFKRVGDEKITQTDTRIISATNKDLKTLINEGKFREDLYYRLKVIRIVLPSLRDRKEDIPLLVNHFLEKYTTGRDRRLEIDKRVLKLLCDHHWPGNVRELENEIQRAVTLATDQITPAVLSPEIRSSAGAIKVKEVWQDLVGKDFLEILATFEKKVLLSALEKANWNQVAAAKFLKIPRTTLRKKMQRYGLFLRHGP